MRLEVEAFIGLWLRNSPHLDLDSEVKRIGDALARMAIELAKAEDP